MKVLITGANGQLGRALKSTMAKKYTLLLTDIKDLDISNLEKVDNYIKLNQPDLVINAAAYTAVDKCEDASRLAYKVNAIGARNLAIASHAFNIPIIHISTDYVFDGEGIKNHEGKLRAYTEFDLPRPHSIYGKTKLSGEEFVKIYNPKHFIVRTAWLYGDGDNFVKTMLNLAKNNEELHVVNDQIGSPTSALELARALESLISSREYGIYHGTCEGQCSWYQFVKKIFEIKNISIDVKPCTTEAYPRPAKRPAYSVLENMMFDITLDYHFAHWEDALIEYLREV